MMSLNVLPEKEWNSDHCHLVKWQDSKTTAVFFNYFDQPVSVKSHWNFVKNIPVNKLFLHSGANDWFQRGVPGVCKSFEELMEFCSSLRLRLQQEEIVFIGHSMGAYAAIACGISACAPRVLASVPEIDLREAGGISYQHLPQELITYPSIRHLIEGNKTTKIEIIYGVECKFDSNVATSIKNPMVRTHGIQCGHTTLPYLRDKGILDQVMMSFVSGEDIGALLKRY